MGLGSHGRSSVPSWLRGAFWAGDPATRDGDIATRDILFGVTYEVGRNADRVLFAVDGRLAGSCVGHEPANGSCPDFEGTLAGIAIFPAGIVMNQSNQARLAWLPSVAMFAPLLAAFRHRWPQHYCQRGLRRPRRWS